MVSSNVQRLVQRVKPAFILPESRDLDLYEITCGDSFNNYHIYMETPVFTPDSKKFIYLRTLNGTHNDRNQDRAHLMLCDIEDGFALRQLTDEHRLAAVCMSLDGRYAYYTVEEGGVGKSRLSFKRVDIAACKRETISVMDTPPHDCRCVPGNIYPLGALSSDGKRYATSGFLGDGRMENAPWGILVFDIASGEGNVVLQGEDYCNAHPQYNPSREHAHDLMIQHNHGCFCDALGNVRTLISGHGADIHVIRDDGTDMRAFPWGRDGAEQCQGHQCWRGGRNTAVTGIFSASLTGRPEQTERLSTTYVESENPLIESAAIRPDAVRMHMGLCNAQGHRNVISRNAGRPHFVHFSFDPTGTYFVSDCLLEGEPHGEKSELVVGTLGDGPDAALNIRPLIYPQTSWKDQQAHPHPFFSPDHRYLLFNSDRSGMAQIYLADNLGLA